MKKQIKRIKRGLGILLCIGFVFGCASSKEGEDVKRMQEEETAANEEVPDPEKVQEKIQGEFSPERQLQQNKDFFWEEADRQKVGWQEGETCLKSLLDDNVFQGGKKKLTGLRIDDIDGNGQVDMLAMVLDAEETPFYGSGGLWFYMNEDEPYCFEEEDCSFYGWFDLFWSDIDSDGNVEVVLSAQGTGCGAVGDSYKAVFKYKNHTIEKMELPSDLEEDYDCGLRVDLIQEPEANRYSAYCPYFDERIFFGGENVEGWDVPCEARVTGGNARGFYDLCPAEYEGKKALQASEYLYGEGGTAHGVATAKFLISWEEDGTPKVIKWWIEENGDSWANSYITTICYDNGYYYYASELDHFYLYRAREDGSDPQRLAKVHPGSLCVQDGKIYFINLSDGQSVCRMNTDGTGMEKLCEMGQKLQVGGEYVYFCSTYEKEFDQSGLVTSEPAEHKDNFLYLMKKDGTDRKLIATDIFQYLLSDGSMQGAKYSGSLFCKKWLGDGIAISKMSLEGENEEELCRYDGWGQILIYGGNLYYGEDIYGERERIIRYNLQDGEETIFLVPPYTDYCIYNGYIYSIDARQNIDARQKDDKYEVKIYRMGLSGENCELIYQNSFSIEPNAYISALCATKGGVFFRKHFLKEESSGWFKLEEDREKKEWHAKRWE